MHSSDNSRYIGELSAGDAYLCRCGGSPLSLAAGSVELLCMASG
ncbi:hypothetical protein TERTU_3901 [Teredinibacter turnerae T7901]|uniref:Uncharacterized protein n=1 Tax=Teredinibacter turnerae (strain ATCC 39867 / T7901) TaxID=377629 RepID=C5BT49_TERTT|nr:hypothetical protein TERTU_3901 [Teredinibacter turnerae T7901]